MDSNACCTSREHHQCPDGGEKSEYNAEVMDCDGWSWIREINVDQVGDSSGASRCCGDRCRPDVGGDSRIRSAGRCGLEDGWRPHVCGSPVSERRSTGGGKQHDGWTLFWKLTQMRIRPK